MTLLAGRQTMVYSGYTVLCTAADGFATSGRDGLYHRDTRLLSRYQLTVDGEPPELVGTAQRESDEWTAVYRVRRPGGTPAGPVLPQDILEIRLRRRVASGLLDELVVENHSNERFQGTLRVDADADFRDVAE